MCQAKFILPDLIRFLKARGIRYAEFSFMTHVGLSWTIHWGAISSRNVGTHITSLNWFSEKWTWPVVIIIRVTNLHMGRCGWVFINEGRGGDVWTMHSGRQERKCRIEAFPPGIKTGREARQHLLYSFIQIEWTARSHRQIFCGDAK